MKTHTLKNPRQPRNKQERLAVRVARDAVKQVRLGNFIATPGSYYNAAAMGSLYRANTKEQCYVCALGAIWASKVRLSGVAEKYAFYDEVDDELNDVMNGYGRLMECAFEGVHTGVVHVADRDIVNAQGRTWKRRFPGSKKRLTSILNNLIRNGGQFRIEDVR